MLLAASVKQVVILGSTWISQQIQENRDLRMRVPRLPTTAFSSQTSARRKTAPAAHQTLPVEARTTATGR
jgi:hypothetical protein